MTILEMDSEVCNLRAEEERILVPSPALDRDRRRLVRMKQPHRRSPRSMRCAARDRP